MLESLLTHWTIRLSLAAYALWLALWLCGAARPTSGKRESWSKWLYTAACVLFLAHVMCAFHFYHHWSHLAAFVDTARQTEQMLGFSVGEGIYFSYLFTLLWVADVVWLWLLPFRRPSWLIAALQLYMAFIALNGAVVFEGGVTRWVGVPVALLLGGLATWRLFTSRPAFGTPHSP